MIELPSIDGDPPSTENCIFFSCDTVYYKKYGIPLINSIVSQIPWVAVHCHVITTDSKTNLIKHPQLTHTIEVINRSFIEKIPVNNNRTFTSEKYNFSPSPLTTYYACSRFLRAADIFNNSHSVLQIDCDSLLFSPFTEQEFKNVTLNPLPTRKTKKTEKILASCISFGSGESGNKFRIELKDTLLKTINLGIYWFIDQDVLEKIFNKVSLESIPSKWNNWNFKDPEAFFRTAKGNKKDSDFFIKELTRWSN
jgi:hypothetical protein